MGSFKKQIYKNLLRCVHINNPPLNLLANLSRVRVGDQALIRRNGLWLGINYMLRTVNPNRHRPPESV